METPTTTDSSSSRQETEANSRSYCETRWTEALKRCKAGLHPEDFEKVTQFQSPDALLHSLSEMEKEYSQATLPTLLHKVEPSLRPLKSFTTAIALSTRSKFIETALIWGFINLLIELAMNSEVILKNIIDMLQDLGHNLELLEIYQSIFSSDSHMAEALVDVFAEVVLFAVSTISYLRSHPVENVALKSWPNMKTKFGQTCESIKRQTRNIKEKAEALSFKTLINQRTLPPLDDISSISLTETSSENPKFFSAVEVPKFPFHHLPFRGIPSFFGRSDLLEKIAAELDYGVGEPRLRKMALWGLAGVGKSQTAFKYASNCCIQGLRVVIWIHGETELQLSEAFSQIAVDLKLSSPEDIAAHTQNRYLVLKWLAETDATWLLIFDNVEDPELLLGYMPVAAHGSILITCRSVTVADSLSGHILEIPSFSDLEGSGLLLSLLDSNESNDIEKDAGKELSNLLGGLPLAVSMMASQIRMRRMNIEKFIPFYKSNHRRLHGSSKTSSAHYYGKNLATVWQFSFTALEEGPALLLGMLSLFSPDSIPESLFLQSSQLGYQMTTEMPLFLQDSWELSETSRELIDKTLISKDPERSLFFVHRLIQTEYRDRMSPEEFQKCFSIASDLLFHAFPQQADGLPLRRYWLQCKELIQHVIALSTAYSEAYSKNTGIVEFKNFTKLIANAAWYLHETNSYNICIDLIMNGFKNCQDLESLPYATLCNIAGCIFSERAQMTQAGDFYNRSLLIREKLLPPDHGELADLYNNIGCLYLAIDDTAQATKYLDKAHKITLSRPQGEREQTLHLRHLNLASLYEVLQQYDRARDEIEKGRRAAVLCFGEGSHFDAAADSHLGNILCHEGNYEEAIIVFQRAMRIFKSEMITQPAVSSVAYKMGRACLKQGQVVRAIELLKEALVICKLNERLKGDEGESARVMRKLAEALILNGEEEDGEKMKKEAERIRKEIQGIQYGQFPDEDKSWDAMVDIIFR